MASDPDDALSAEGADTEALPEVSAAVPAAAAEPLEAAKSEPGAPALYAAPTCIESRVTSGGGVTVTNWCGEQRNIKVLFAFGRDSACIPLPHGYEVHVYKPNPTANFDGVDDC